MSGAHVWRRFLQKYAVAGLTAVAAFAFPLQEVLAATSPAPRVMVYGDSLSAAYGIDPKAGWVALLEARLGRDGVTVVNSSISGETTSGGLSRIKSDLARIRPTIVVLELGANDGLRGLPVADMQRNLQGMIAAILAAKARVVLVGVQIPPNYGIEYTQQFRDAYASLAKKNNVLLVPFLLEGFADRLEWFQADRMHPVAEAQPRILENVLPAVRQALAQAHGPAHMKEHGLVHGQAPAPANAPSQTPIRAPAKAAATR